MLVLVANRRLRVVRTRCHRERPFIVPVRYFVPRCHGQSETHGRSRNWQNAHPARDAVPGPTDDRPIRRTSAEIVTGPLEPYVGESLPVDGYPEAWSGEDASLAVANRRRCSLAAVNCLGRPVSSSPC